MEYHANVRPPNAVPSSKMADFGSVAPENLLRGGEAEEHPHAEKSEPGEELHDSELLHRARHFADGVGDFRAAHHEPDRRADAAADEHMPCGECVIHQRAARGSEERARDSADEQEHRVKMKGLVRPLLPLELGHVFRRIFLARENGVEHREQERRGPELERIHNGERYAVRRTSRDAVVREDRRQRIGHRCADADEKALHHETRRALLRRKLVGDEGAKGFHRDVDARIHHPEHRRRDPERGRVWHEKEGDAGKDCAHGEVGTPPPEPVPGAVAHAADDGLDEQSRHRPGEPEQRDFRRLCTELRVDRAHVCELEAEPELDAQEAEAHVKNLREREAGFVHGRKSVENFARDEPAYIHAEDAANPADDDRRAEPELPADPPAERAKDIHADEDEQLHRWTRAT